MNLRRGFWRFWFVISAMWVALILAFVLSAVSSLTDGREAQRELSTAQKMAVAAQEAAQVAVDEALQEKAETSDIDELRRQIEEIARARVLEQEAERRRVEVAEVRARIANGNDATGMIVTLAWIALIPPVVLLILGTAIGWAFSGFKRSA